MTISQASLKRGVSRLIWRLNLQNLVFRLREIRMAWGAEANATDDRGAPLPPPYLRVQVAGGADAQHFLATGEQSVEGFDALLRRSGHGFAEARHVLDIGCGCGRQARWVLRLNPRLTGIDINPLLVSWCRRNLAGEWKTLRLGDDIPAAEGAFDVAYAVSVITHLREATAATWLAQIARVLEPGGRFLVTFHDEHHPNASPIAEDLARDGYAVRWDSLEGSNHLAAFVTADRLRQLAAPHFEALDYAPSNQSAIGHAVLVLRRL
jgi:SAM-dependent methyltransferase